MTEAYGLDHFKPQAELLREDSAKPTIIVEPPKLTMPSGLRLIDEEEADPQDGL